MSRESTAIHEAAAESDETSHVARQWLAHPAREQPGRAAVGAAWIVATSVVIYATTFDIFWTAFAGLFLILFLHRFFIPTSYTIDEEGISQLSMFGTRRLLWTDVKRFVHDQNGGFLSRRANPSWLDDYRGLHVAFGRETDDVASLIRARIAKGRVADRREPSTAPNDGDMN